MTEEQDSRKISLADAIRQKLEQKKQNTGSPRPGQNQLGSAKKLTSQNTKKPNNQRRRTGGS
ncbi:hypothetical protein PASE110613_13175 [Paenibacillus sediminis]|uniref:Uncharacterized protein n=1 Tax=Paenibacillus sediminis TaxID=664909 RepID=A0ABS4H3L8_9BACL|nr:hypothetical protein [Paenibacillus sediminis]MBP1937125.1 hypothetical protein [Paenibacillus sediminis]